LSCCFEGHTSIIDITFTQKVDKNSFSKAKQYKLGFEKLHPKLKALNKELSSWIVNVRKQTNRP
jgi:hypothetical protein